VCGRCSLLLVFTRDEELDITDCIGDGDTSVERTGN
jgi:hypothetical protein